MNYETKIIRTVKVKKWMLFIICVQVPKNWTEKLKTVYDKLVHFVRRGIYHLLQSLDRLELFTKVVIRNQINRHSTDIVITNGVHSSQRHV